MESSTSKNVRAPCVDQSLQSLANFFFLASFGSVSKLRGLFGSCINFGSFEPCVWPPLCACVNFLPTFLFGWQGYTLRKTSTMRYSFTKVSLSTFKRPHRLLCIFHITTSIKLLWATYGWPGLEKGGGVRDIMPYGICIQIGSIWLRITQINHMQNGCHIGHMWHWHVRHQWPHFPMRWTSGESKCPRERCRDIN